MSSGKEGDGEQWEGGGQGEKGVRWQLKPHALVSMYWEALVTVIIGGGGGGRRSHTSIKILSTCPKFGIFCASSDQLLAVRSLNSMEGENVNAGQIMWKFPL